MNQLIKELDPFGTQRGASSKYAQLAKQRAAQTPVLPDTIGDYSEDRSPGVKARDAGIDLVNPVAHGEFVSQALRDPKKLLNDPLSMLFPHLGPAIGSLF